MRKRSPDAARTSTSCAGYPGFVQYHRSRRRPSSPRSSRICAISSARDPNSSTSRSHSGSSAAAQRRWAARIYGFSGSITACSLGRASRYSGLRIRYWSRASSSAISTTRASSVPRPARPARCQVLAIVPGYPTNSAASRDPTSMPSSRALVEATPSNSPLKSRRSMARRSSGKYPAR